MVYKQAFSGKMTLSEYYLSKFPCLHLNQEFEPHEIIIILNYH